MDSKHIHSPVEVDDGGWRGKVTGVTRVGAKAGIAAAAILAALVVLIVYGISTAGHRHTTTGGSEAPIPKPADQQNPWWDAFPNAQATPIPSGIVTPTVPILSTAEPIIKVQRNSGLPRVPSISAQAAGASEARSARQQAATAAQAAPILVPSNGGASQISAASQQPPSEPSTVQGPPIGSPRAAGTNLDPRTGFLADAATSLSRDRLLAVRQDDPSPYELHAGSVIPATLLTGINADLPGTIVAQVRDDVFDSVSGEYLLIPQGTRLVGTYDSRIVQGQRRVLVAWTRLLFPDGSSLDLSGMAGTDPAGYAGFGANVDDHINKTIDSALLLSIISAGAQLSQPQRSANINGLADVGQTIAGALGQQIGNTSLQLAQRQLQIPPTLEVPPGYVFDVLVDRDIVMAAPYVQEASP